MDTSKLRIALYRLSIRLPWQRPNNKKVARALEIARPVLSGKVTLKKLDEARELLWGKN